MRLDRTVTRQKVRPFSGHMHRRGKTSPQDAPGGRQVRGKTRLAVDRSAGQATPGLLAAPVYQTVYRCESQVAREQLAQTFLLSEWWIRPGGGFCRWMAMVRAAMAKSARIGHALPSQRSFW